MSSHAVLCACVDVDIEEGRRLRLEDDNPLLKDINASEDRMLLSDAERGWLVWTPAD